MDESIAKAASPDDPARSGRTRRKAARAATIGTLLEYYDFTLFAGAAATIFPRVFFPDASPFLASFQSIAIFSVAYVVRPVASWVLASLGDRIGRKRILIRTLMIMGFATFFVGLLPSHDSIGIAAPILLLALRLAQGVGAAGEFNGAVVVAFEFAPKNRRGLYGSFPAAGPPLGGVLGSVVLLATSSVVGESQFFSWGWRIPFLVGGLLAVYAFFLRRQLPETPEFRRSVAAGTTSRTPLRDALRSRPGMMAALFMMFFALGAHGNLYPTFGASFAARTAGLSSTAVFTAILIGYLSLAVLLPLYGWLSDFVGRRLVVGFGFVALAVFAFPFFWFIQPDWPIGLWIGLFLSYGLATAAVFGPSSTLVSELLPTTYRYSGLALSRETGNAIGAGVIPPLAVVLTSDGSTVTLSIVLVGFAILGLVCLLVLPRLGQGNDDDESVASPVSGATEEVPR